MEPPPRKEAKMARKSDRRDSRTADRNGGRSPFASSLPIKRVRAAEAMVAKREQEIEELNALLANETRPAVQRRLSTRLLGTTNSLNSWLDYLAEGSPKETRAVVTP
jgi:hypothetical protein